jgi:hypothetical protein
VGKTLETTEAELMHTVFAHPTMSEAMHESVLAAYGRALHLSAGPESPLPQAGGAPTTPPACGRGWGSLFPTERPPPTLAKPPPIPHGLRP